MELQLDIASIQFGAPRSQFAGDGSRLELAVPVLAGCPIFHLPIEAARRSQTGDWSLCETDSILCARGLARVNSSPNEVAKRLFQEAFAIAGDRHIYRFWNFIPKINRITGDLENYRAFGYGRHQAFVERFGAETAAEKMPAATGVGIEDNALVVILLAGNARPEHHENPKQVPAYLYPRRYGPRPPSFARATTVEIGGLRYCFLAGTSSVLGHDSVGVGDLRAQTEVTLDNIDTMSAQMGLPPSLGRGCGLKRTFRIYLRRPADLEAARTMVEDGLLEPGDDVVWLKADICRSDLDIEIDATVIG
jgi:enamine deaminase RidA (YjgF/YER057c/UK114 family)